MKIATLCFLHPHKVPGGQQRVAYDLFHHAARKYGREASLLIASDFQLEPMRTADSSRLVEVAPNEFVYVCRRYEYDYFTNFDFAGQLEMIRLLESFKPDVVHMHHFLGFGLDFVAFMRARLPQARLVFTFHEFIPICHNNGHLRRKYDGGICDEVHAVRCQQCFPEHRLDYFEHRKEFFAGMFGNFHGMSTVSEFAKKTLARNLPVESEIRVIPNGPIRAAAPAAHAKPPRSGRTVFGFIGQVHPLKGVDQLLDAMLDLVKDGAVSPRRVELQIHGNPIDAAYHQHLDRRMAQAAEAQLKATLRGKYSPTNLEQVFSEIDIVVVPSMWPETYCLTADEAILAGKTLVCANVPAILERVKPSKGTFFYESGSVRDMKRALLEALEAWKEGEWEDSFSVPLTTGEEVFEAYERELYVARVPQAAIRAHAETHQAMSQT
jgi:glycosyltransferase involved in cell wall biosynthesis